MLQAQASQHVVINASPTLTLTVIPLHLAYTSAIQKFFQLPECSMLFNACKSLHMFAICWTALSYLTDSIYWTQILLRTNSSIFSVKSLMIPLSRVNHSLLWVTMVYNTTYTIPQLFVSMSCLPLRDYQPLRAGTRSSSLCPLHSIWHI